MFETFDEVKEFWDNRYAQGGNSGSGSQGEGAARKAAFINSVIKRYGVKTLLDWGCGDGEVARLVKVQKYVGLEVSPTALELCKSKIKAKKYAWFLFDGFKVPRARADLALSIDVIFHLTDEASYKRHMELLFESAPLVIVHSSNKEGAGWRHIRHRSFLEDIPYGWTVEEELLDPDSYEGLGFWLLKAPEADSGDA